MPDDRFPDLDDQLRSLFGHRAFRPGQREIVEAALSGEDVLAILPTGGGKSVTFQLPAMLGDGATLILSPLIALMKDQIENLPPAVGAVTTLINSSLDQSEVGKRISQLRSGRTRIVYAAPERLRQPAFVHALRAAGVRQVVIDEAHCISQWGHDFRPDYRAVGRSIAALEPRNVLAVTATATPEVQADIEKQIGRPLRRLMRPTWRENLFLGVRQVRSEDDKLWATVEICSQNEGAGLVYASSRDKCEQIARMLQRQGIAAGFYHAGLPPEERAAAQDRFMSGDVRVMAATVAFGMGVDKSDIRFLLHYQPSRTLENYYQEAGRAGRDGAPAVCTLLFSSGDSASMTRRLNEDAVGIAQVRDAYRAVREILGRRRCGPVAFDALAASLGGDEGLVRTALPILEEAGLIRRHDDLPRGFFLSAEMMADGETPGSWEAIAAALGQGGRWDPVELSDTTGIPLPDLETAILDCQDAGLLTYRAQGGRTFCVELLPPPDNAIAQLEQMLAHRAKGAAERTEAMRAYARERTCRHRQIARYFGDAWPRRTCGACDVCTGGSEGATSAKPAKRTPRREQTGEPVAVLRLVRDIAPFALGRTGLVRSLRGTPDAPLRPGRAPDVGALESWTRTDVERLIDALTEHGCLQRDESDEYRRLSLTETGAAALQAGELGFEWRSAPAPTAAPAALAPTDQPLADALRAWRKERAALENVPAFAVFPDKVLNELAARRPVNEFDLLAVPGIGPAKAAKYGDAVFEVVRRHA